MEIAEQKRKRLEQYLQERPQQAPSMPSITRRAPGATIPLTFSQQQVWLHAQLAPDAPVYNEPFTVHRKGPLDVAALERSFTEIIRRHEAWRTTFPVVNGQPVQMVHPPFEIKLPVVDLRNLPQPEAAAEALRLAGEDARHPFDLVAGPLVRTKLVRLAEEDYRLFVTCHHLIFDGITGYQVFLPELVSLYQAFSHSLPSPLPELPFQYADYAVWQRESESGEALKPQLDFWRQRLAGSVPVLQLPVDRPRPDVETFRGAMQSFTLSRELTTGLRELSRQQGVTLFMTLLAALNTLLARYSGQDEILVGSITAGRDHPGTQELLGFFLNTVVLRTDLGGDPMFQDLLARVRNTTIDALSHDKVSLEQVVRELHPDRDFSRNPLFRVLLSLEPALTEVEPGWNLTPIDVETGTSKFDLCLVLDDRADGLSGRMIYSSDLFNPETIAQMVECWQILLQAVVKDPGQPISRIPLVPERERQNQLGEWSDTAKPYPITLVHHRVEQLAKQSPQVPAVKCGQQGLSYGELNERSEKLAHYLRKLGVGPETPVALCLGRSLDMFVGILGVMKAGGAYVPLDPAYPKERLEFMLRDSGAPVLLTQSHLRPLEPSSKTPHVIRLDSDWDTIARESTSSLLPTMQPENLAYLIYTSGSTGGPKGVEVNHRTLAQSTSARLDYYGGSAQTFLLLSSFAFDSSVATIFHALCTGATLVLPGPEFNWEARQIAELIAANRITSILCVPSLYAELLQAAEAGQLASLERVIVAGEACTRHLVELHYRTLPQALLFNEYGPTEATVWSTVYRCGSAEQLASTPIGRPIANTQTYVLDRNLQLLPTGVPGELYIAGEGVARGYWNHPGLTQQKFVRNPFADDPHARMYRTGDLVRYLPDGNLQFLGRLDEQVKIRGLRIELGEIESLLSEHPDVQEAVIATTGEAEHQPSLVAFVVVKQQYATSGAELRAFLAARLPNHMVPSAFTFVPELPRLPNGKVDRQALSAGVESPTDLQPSGPVEPRDSVESRLLAIWKEVLGTTSSDVTQDFFQLGGHSLLAATLLYRIEQEFGQALSLAFVFQAPTIELMADGLRSPDQSLEARAIIGIQPKGSKPPLFCVRGGPRFRLLAGKLGLDQPFLGLDIPYSDAIKLPTPYRIEDIAAFMVRAMRERQPHGPYYLAGLCVNAVIAYEVARQLKLQGEDIGLLAMFDGHNQAYYKSPFRDGRYTGRIKYHLRNILQSDMREGSAYIRDRLEEMRRKIERTMWQLTAEQEKNGKGNKLRNTDAIVHPAFHRYEPKPYPGRLVMFQSSDWPPGDYFDFEVGWKDLVEGPIEFHRIPGDHPGMFTEPNVNVVAEKLGQLLSRF